MSTNRKTIRVERLVEKANAMLAGPTTAEQRIGVMGLVESVLFETDNYAGFSYLRSEWGETGLREGYDDTRRVYYCKG